MMRGLLVGAAVIGAMALSGQAQAQNFTGLYVGGNVGYVGGEVEDTDIDGWNSAGDQWEFDIDGAAAGVQVGYDWATGGAWRFGVVGEIGVANVTGDGPTPTSIDTFGDIEIDNYVLARARGGFVFGGGNSFVYGTAGAGWVHIDAVAHDRLLVPGGGLMEGSNDEYVTAVVYGVGFEQQIGPRLSIGGEWLRMDADDIQVVGLDAGDEYRFDFDTEADIIRFTANWAY
jgi:hypothetical protein